MFLFFYFWVLCEVIVFLKYLIVFFFFLKVLVGVFVEFVVGVVFLIVVVGY